MKQEIVIHAPDGSTKKVALDGTRLSLGRSSENDLSYPEDVSLSRRHLVLQREGDAWFAEDPGSKNGTFVNGSRISARTRLRQGDRLTAGHLVLVFDDPGGGIAPPVVFYPGEGEAPEGTVMTDLAGILSRETTRPGVAAAAASAVAKSAPERRLEVSQPAISVLVRAGRELVGHRPLSELFHVILDLSMEAVGAERGVVMTLEDGRLTVQAVRGEGFRISAAVRDRVLLEKASLLVRDTRLDEAFRSRQSIHDQQILTMMAVPLQTKDRVIGLIHVDSRFFVRRFTPEDLDLLTVLANVAAIRIEQERLVQVEQSEKMMERELQQAAEIQRRLLSNRIPAVPGLELVGYNVPCRTVGGDYYEFFSLPDGRIAIVLADVAGKGMAAALVMSSLQSRVQVLVEEPHDLARLVSRLDRHMSTNLPDNRFVTLFLCVLDPATGEIRYCNAGHNPPLLVREGGKIDRLESSGTVLGILPEIGYEERVATMARGDVLALFSDGITEAPGPQGDEFGEARLADLLRARRTDEATTILDAVNDAIAGWTAGAAPADDITLLVVRRTAE
jgi:serine phosphatase RsbU (regulator of sigma subunit)/pSer/pThr/pTyr-binding forkhead associated (FHA) protein